MWIAKMICAPIDELIYKKQAALKHLLMDQYTAAMDG
jgi:hypothetical protein